MTCEQLRYDYMTFDCCKTWAFEKVQTDPSCQAAKLPQWVRQVFSSDSTLAFFVSIAAIWFRYVWRALWICRWCTGWRSHLETYQRMPPACRPSISYLWMFVSMWMEVGSVVQIGCVRRSDQAPCGGKWHAGHCSALIPEFLIIELEPKEHRSKWLHGCTRCRNLNLSTLWGCHEWTEIQMAQISRLVCCCKIIVCRIPTITSAWWICLSLICILHSASWIHKSGFLCCISGTNRILGCQVYSHCSPWLFLQNAPDQTTQPYQHPSWDNGCVMVCCFP